MYTAISAVFSDTSTLTCPNCQKVFVAKGRDWAVEPSGRAVHSTEAHCPSEPSFGDSLSVAIFRKLHYALMRDLFDNNLLPLALPVKVIYPSVTALAQQYYQGMMWHFEIGCPVANA